MFIEVELMLSIDQFWRVHPSISFLYPDDETFVVFDRTDVAVSSVIGLNSKPRSLLRLCNYVLIPMNAQVNLTFCFLLL